mmetsp:Transcript_406/g.1148  ORF Transcript_406/g.1148 Transcript_406/m.1148 type:complete len:264 (-) Transcript_406:1937-2728(-)
MVALQSYPKARHRRPTFTKSAPDALVGGASSAREMRGELMGLGGTPSSAPPSVSSTVTATALGRAGCAVAWASTTVSFVGIPKIVCDDSRPRPARGLAGGRGGGTSGTSGSSVVAASGLAAGWGEADGDGDGDMCRRRSSDEVGAIEPERPPRVIEGPFPPFREAAGDLDRFFSCCLTHFSAFFRCFSASFSALRIDLFNARTSLRDCDRDRGATGELAAAAAAAAAADGGTSRKGSTSEGLTSLVSRAPSPALELVVRSEVL